MSGIRENITGKLIALTIFKPVPGGYVCCAPGVAASLAFVFNFIAQLTVGHRPLLRASLHPRLCELGGLPGHRRK